MEVKTSVAGQKRYPRELKRLAVEKKRNENWTWSKTIKWIETEHGIKVPASTCSKWVLWYKEDQEGRAGISSSESINAVGTLKWQPEEDDLLRMLVDNGFTAGEIAEFMNDTPELNFRKYTSRSIESRRMRLNIKTNKSSFIPNKDIIEGEVEENHNKKDIE